MSWRNSIKYVNQVTPEYGAATKYNYTEKKSRHHRKPRYCEKYVGYSLDNGAVTSVILFKSNGRVFVGPDVWRLSDPYDCCEYPYTAYPNMRLAMMDYLIKEDPRENIVGLEVV